LKLVPRSGAVESVRTVKDGSEVAAIKRASAIMARALRETLAETAAGSSEKDIRAGLESRMIMSGAEGIAFDTIAASGPRSAYAHGAPTDRKLAPGDFAVIDFGARVDGYNSDITRTAHVGRPAAAAARMYRAVLEARNSAVEAAVPGAPGEAPDRAARVALRKYGLEQYFTHGLGHGVGLEVHERPRLAPGAKEKLVPGMVFTIEPGVYIKGLGGVRIEDTFLQTKDGPVPLTSGSRLLRVI
jgi:Xaa-Pro aminopeptidase